jgi:hypothetical protein
VNAEKPHNLDENRFSGLLKNTEEPFNASAWELYLAFKGKLQPNADPKPFRPHAWKYFEFDKTRTILAIILGALTILITGLLVKPSKPNTTIQFTGIDTANASLNSYQNRNSSAKPSPINTIEVSNGTPKTSEIQKFKNTKRTTEKTILKKDSVDIKTAIPEIIQKSTTAEDTIP